VNITPQFTILLLLYIFLLLFIYTRINDFIKISFLISYFMFSFNILVVNFMFSIKYITTKSSVRDVPSSIYLLVT
jgi:hypothetical protein